MKRLGVVLILLLAFCGLADSIYLAQHEASGSPLICNIQNLSGCNIVAASEYSRVFGIPLAEYGVLFYSILFVLAALEIVLYDRLLRRVLQGFALVDFASSLYFTFVQVYFIKALCVYCLASATISVFIFFLATLIEPLRKAPALESNQLPANKLPMPPLA